MNNFSKIKLLCLSFICFVSLTAFADDFDRSKQAKMKEQLMKVSEFEERLSPEQKKINSQLLRNALSVTEPELLKSLPDKMRKKAMAGAKSAASKVNVEINVKSVVQETLILVEQSGGVIMGQYPQFDIITAELPLGALETVAADNNVLSIRPLFKPIVKKINTSEGRAAHYADLAQSIHSVSGAGIKIGVISDGVDSLTSLQNSGDLPAVTILPGQSGSGTEGTAMLEIIHDVAPNAQLYFATVGDSPAQFAQNILNLKSLYDVDIIVDDVEYFTQPWFQPGIVAQAAQTVTQQGVHYLTAGGNDGNKNDNTSMIYRGFFNGNNDQLRFHSFSGNDIDNRLRGGDFSAFIVLQWNDRWGASTNDYSLALWDQNDEIVAISDDFQEGQGDVPFEAISLGNNVSLDGLSLTVAANDLSGGFARRSFSLKLFVLSSAPGAVPRLQYNSAGTITGHAATSSAVYSLAAANAKAYGRFRDGVQVQRYSSDGNSRIYYNASGNLINGNLTLSGGRFIAKPNFTAADNVSTATPGFASFSGTSAAAPHAAAIFALMLEANPNLTRGDIYRRITSTSFAAEAAGRDRDSGLGVLNASMLACPARFNDVLCGARAGETEFGHAQIQAFAEAGITSGCGNGNYCPSESVTREQMAVFLLRSKYGANYTPPAAQGLFSDVPMSNPFVRWIEQLSREGITGGCGVGKYCPKALVNREQMAVFVLRALNGSSYSPPPAQGVFSDVRRSNVFARWIEQFAQEGITGGCGGGRYCPKGSVTRSQMAIFLVRAFGL